MTLVRDLIDIPEHVHRGDFVLRITEAVPRSRETLASYVVTPQLATCFDQALGFIHSAVQGATSKASYLHGSFGSGKSHFMAVLHLLLSGDPGARSIPELQAVVRKHDTWLEGRKFLLVPYHMIGARSMEAAILGGYAEHAKRAHGDAPLAGVYLAERIFDNAKMLRGDLGDERFFDRLNEGGAGGGGGWGALATSWDSATFDAAMRATPTAPERTRLVGDLVTRFFPAYRDIAAAGDEMFVPIDDGLSILAQHAKGLGYDALVLFLDELILWLASHVAQMEFVNREGQKLAKLVEATRSDRPIPIVSFVARQRDLRELVGQHAPGAERLAFADVLRWWEGRFHTISLEDRNLPAIAEKRILAPRSEAARIEIDQAFRETHRVREEVRRVLLGSEADDAMFRQVYPFTPALVQALIAVSSALQRERTALKVMAQLLVEQRDTLELGEIVPVGDLFDAIAEGDEPFNEDMRIAFENAKKLYSHKLLPLLEQEHGARREVLENRPREDAARRAFEADGRLIKTLLLSALVPEVEALRALTGGKLSALNHGSIRAPIQGQEGPLVLAKCRNWATRVGEIKIGEGMNPTISVQVTGVDTDMILAKAQNVDNFGARLVKIRDLVFAELGIRFEDRLWQEREISWRGTRRVVQVVYGNVRELPDESLRATESGWKVVIDFPFDVQGHTAADDRARVEQFRERGVSTLSVCWLPSFLTLEMQDDLGTLVKLEHILAGERFEQYASHLSAVDRQSARVLLENRQSTLRQQLLLCLRGAYGITAPIPGSLDAAHDASETFQSLEQGFEPRPPVGANLGVAFDQLLDQMLSHQLPAHPDFGVEIKGSVLRRVHEEVERAIHAPNERILVDRTQRTELRAIANPLRLGEMGEDAFVLGHHWRMHFLQKSALDGGPITVAKLRAWMDEPRPMGAPREVQNLVILLFADQTNRSFFLHGGPITPSLDQLPDEAELREQALPSEEDWKQACERAAVIFGVAASPIRNATSVASLSSQVKGKAGAEREHCNRIAALLPERLQRAGGARACPRMSTATALAALLDALDTAEQAEVVGALSRATIATSTETMAKHLVKAAAMRACLEQADRWELFEGVARLTGDRAAAAQALATRVREALEQDELAIALAPALEAAAREAVRLLARPVEPSPPPPGTRVIEEAEREGLSAADAERVLGEVRSKLAAAPRRRLSVRWRITEDGPGS